MTDLPTFARLAGIALIVLAAVAPLAYCTAATEGRRARVNDLVLACINARGEWKAEGWGPYVCVFPKPNSQ